jgi:hypothetical protein
MQISGGTCFPLSISGNVQVVVWPDEKLILKGLSIVLRKKLYRFNEV